MLLSDVGRRERAAQERVVGVFRDQLGYAYLGNWRSREDNNNIEPGLLEANLQARGYERKLILRAVEQLRRAAAVGAGHGLYEANRAVYELLRYGVKVRSGIGEQFETVWLVDWEIPEANDFAVAEEVTVLGTSTKRPDVVVYLNGIAVATLELKRSTVNVSEGIRQTIGNQRPEFIRSFFSTVQFVFAGNDVEGLRYGVIDTPEKYWLEWKEPSPIANPLDRALQQLCDKSWLLEVIHDFVVYDQGVKKAARHNQYFGVKAAQERIARHEGGIIWHTQGSGKSLTMVWLAKWIREHQPDARVLLITDRTELDEQIEQVFAGVNEHLYRAKSAADLLTTLNSSQEWLIGSLVHKFGAADRESQRDKATAEFIDELNRQVPKDFHAKGNVFVFVDEAHRTQSGDMHRAMKQLLPNAMFIGFTGTPLLKNDKATSIETFGSFIHTYKFDEAVADGVVLDLRYEARRIDQRLTSSDGGDQWFELKTRGMTDLAKAELKKRWGTMQKVVSSESRTKQIVHDILVDMETKPRLMDRRGNAMLVGSSIYQACQFYELFVRAGFQGKCAIVTSYVPNPSDIALEDAGSGISESAVQYAVYRQMLADYFDEPAETAVTKVEEFEQSVKRQFIENPGQMRLLIVVDKLLTGFDAPSATYLYIDKKMRDHGLFQAICRVNRLDGEDKEYGYIVDYRDLFNSLETAITDYTSDALDGYDKHDVEGLLKDRITQARDDLDERLEQVRALIEPVARPRNRAEYFAYFCGEEADDQEQLKAREPKRIALYQAVAGVARAYGNLANEMLTAGYTPEKATEIKDEVAHYVNVRTEVKLRAGEQLDFKQYEADMRYLLDTYIQASASQSIADFQDTGLIQLIVEKGAGAMESLPPGIQRDPEAVADTVISNMRKVIVDEHVLNPKYYESMSALLDSIIEQRRQDSLSYEQYLAKLIETAQQLGARESRKQYPGWVEHAGQQALVDFFDDDDILAQDIDEIVMNTKPDSWVGHPMKERKLQNALRATLPNDFPETQFSELFDLLKARDEYR